MSAQKFRSSLSLARYASPGFTRLLSGFRLMLRIFESYQITAMTNPPKSRSNYDRTFYLLLGLSLSLTAILTAFQWSSPEQIDRLWVDYYDQQEVFEFIELSKNVEIEEELKQKQRPNPNPQLIVTTPDPEPNPEPGPEPDPVPVTEPHPGVGVIEIPDDTSPDTDVPFITVEEMPVYPGGEAALFADVSRNFKVPAIDRYPGLEGTIHLSFVVNASGEVVDVKILRGLSPATDAEAIRAIQKLKRFSPGKQRGRPVSVIYTIPIRVMLR